MNERELERLLNYEPTQEDVAFTQALEPFHWEPEQRRAVQKRASAICAELDEHVPNYMMARDWIFEQDHSDNAIPFEEWNKLSPPYEFGASPYEGALEYLVDCVRSRAWCIHSQLVAVEIWQERMSDESTGT
jgi:TorA maturation chaperone TorD